MSKQLVENQSEWTLWSYKPFKDYPSTWYFWIDINGVIKYCRSIEPLGYLAAHLPTELWIWKNVNLKILKELGCKKVNTKMTQEELSKGWLTTH